MESGFFVQCKKWRGSSRTLLNLSSRTKRRSREDAGASSPSDAEFDWSNVLGHVLTTPCNDYLAHHTVIQGT